MEKDVGIIPTMVNLLTKITAMDYSIIIPTMGSAPSQNDKRT